MASVEDYMKEQPEKEPDGENVEIKRESLAILASLGTIKEYLGENMSLGDVKRLSTPDVEKYFVRYQTVLGKQITGGLVDSTIQAAVQVISCVVSIDDSDALCKDLQNDALVKRELSNFAGLLALKGGRLVALASGLFQVAKHVKLRESEVADTAIQEGLVSRVRESDASTTTESAALEHN